MKLKELIKLFDEYAEQVIVVYESENYRSILNAKGVVIRAIKDAAVESIGVRDGMLYMRLEEDK